MSYMPICRFFQCLLKKYSKQFNFYLLWFIPLQLCQTAQKEFLSSLSFKSWLCSFYRGVMLYSTEKYETHRSKKYPEKYKIKWTLRVISSRCFEQSISMTALCQVKLNNSLNFFNEWKEDYYLIARKNVLFFCGTSYSRKIAEILFKEKERQLRLRWAYLSVW